MGYKSLVVATLVMAGAGSLGAQVGYPPRQSPYRDLEHAHEITWFSGYYHAKPDPARVAPQSGVMAGAHYDWRLTGPLSLTADVSRVESQRRVLDPEAPGTCSTSPPEDCKLIDTFRWPLYFGDVGLAMSLTGARSFRRIVPDLRAGAGIVSDFHTKPDVGDFAFGTRFAFSWGAGIRYVPGSRYQVRVDFVNHLYSVTYPESYYESAGDGSRILEPARGRSRTRWLNNPALTIGLSYLFAR